MNSMAKYFLAVTLLIHSNGLIAQAKNGSFGVAWRVIGSWNSSEEDRSISAGDPIYPGSLLRPVEGTHEHSITILLPDGQRVLYECFTEQVCARGFRVPSLYRKPEPAAIDLLARVNAVSMQKDKSARLTRSAEEFRVPRDEAVVALEAGNKVQIEGLAAALSNGKYSYEVRPLSPGSSRQTRQAFEKSSRSIRLTLPSEGLFDVMIADSLNTPRIDLLLAAVRPARASELVKSFQDVKALLEDWNEDYQGWPVHDFQRDFLQSALLSIKPLPLQTVEQIREVNEKHDTRVTAEPRFSPAPGVFNGDVAVTLRCDTLSATIYFTVDGSQPMNNSSSYRAPIIVKGTALTIKAFASAKGKKDSPTVTGIFRIGD